MCGSLTDGNKIFTIWNEIPTGAKSTRSEGCGGSGGGFRRQQLLPSCGRGRRDPGRGLWCPPPVTLGFSASPRGAGTAVAWACPRALPGRCRCGSCEAQSLDATQAPYGRALLPPPSQPTAALSSASSRSLGALSPALPSSPCIPPPHGDAHGDLGGLEVQLKEPMWTLVQATPHSH